MTRRAKRKSSINRSKSIIFNGLGSITVMYVVNLTCVLHTIFRYNNIVVNLDVPQRCGSVISEGASKPADHEPRRALFDPKPEMKKPFCWKDSKMNNVKQF